MTLDNSWELGRLTALGQQIEEKFVFLNIALQEAGPKSGVLIAVMFNNITPYFNSQVPFITQTSKTPAKKIRFHSTN